MIISKTTITLQLLAVLLSVFSSTAEDQHIAQVSTNRYYFCDKGSNNLIAKTINSSGGIVRTKIFKKKQAKRLTSELKQEIKNLKQTLKSTKGRKKQVKLESQLSSKIAIQTGIKKCLNGEILVADDKTLSGGQLPPDLVLPDNYNINLQIKGELTGTCNVKGKTIAAYQDSSELGLIAPLSGQLTCTLQGTRPTQDLLLKISKKGSAQDIIYSKTITNYDIKPDLSFSVSICPDFPGCFNANLLAKYISESGIEISLEKL